MYEERDRMIESIREMERVIKEKKKRLEEMNLACLSHMVSFFGLTLEDLGEDRDMVVSRHNRLHTIEFFSQEDLCRWEEVMDLLEQMGRHH